MDQARIRSVCPYCGVGCGIVMEVAEGRVVKVSGDKAHPANRGRLCTKGGSCHVPITGPGRADSAWARILDSTDQRPIAMEDAIRRTADGLRGIIDRDGPDAVALYVSGQMSLEAQYLANKLAKGFIRTRHIESNSRLCMASAGSGYKLSLGADAPPGSYDDFDRTDLFFVIGANMADCHPILFLRMMDRVKQGARLIVVDPRRTATAEKAGLFLQIRPGTDLALLNGLLHLLHAGGHTDAAFIAAHTEGWGDMPGFLADYPPERVSQITGIPEADLRRAADWIGAAPDWISLWTMGLNQSTHGTWNTNAICNLHLATGAICRPGAGPFSLTGQPNAMGGREMGYMGPGLPGQRSALSPADRAFTEDVWRLPAGTLRAEAGSGTVDLFRQMADGTVKACWIICTNPAATVANRDNVLAGLRRADLVIVQDAFLDTETTRHADIVLPAALWAEADGVMINSERNMTFCPKAVPPPGSALPDWQIITRVACEMGYADAFPYTSAAEIFEEIRRFANPATGYDLRGADHARLRETPVQWPCGPDAPPRNPIRYADLRFPTETGRARFLARPHAAPAEMPDAEFPMVLNTGRLQHQWHTMTKTGKVPVLTKLNPAPFVELHPADAAELGIATGDRVEIRSRRGRAVLPAEVSDRVQPGNCFAPFHWNDSFGEDLAINAATSDATDPISQQPEFKFAAVALTRAPGPAGGPVSDKRSPPVKHTLPEHLSEDPRIDAFLRLVGLPAVPVPVLTPVEATWLSGFTTGLRSPEGQDAIGAPQIPGNAPLAEETRHYVNGVLAGLYARVSPAAAPPPAASPARLVLWASQTGNAEAAAAGCADRLAAAGAVRLVCMADARPDDLARAEDIICVVSTFGDGDPPDNGAAFWSALMAETPGLAGKRHAVLAFGDPSYDSFCGFGRQLDARLAALGSTAIVARGECDPDGAEQVDTWVGQLAAALGGAAPVPPAVPAPARFNRTAPLQSRLLRNQRLGGAGSAREVRQFGFDLGDSGMAYRAGDALGVWPRNCPDLVAEILDLLALPPDAPVAVKSGEVALAEALAGHLDIGRPGRALLEAVARHRPDAGFAPLLAAGQDKALAAWLHDRQIADVLAETRPTLSAADLAEGLRPLQPRLYSIASSELVLPREVQLTVSVLRYGKGRKGTCSAYLADRCTGDVAIFAQPSAHFHPPADGTRDIIMVGPGTGIAPFRGFLQERAATGASGRNWLFFGAQNAAHDFYYQDEIMEWQASGHLARLDLAFSRDQAAKIYVQDRMEEQGADLWRWLEGGACFYVCGDAARMARDVEAALHRVAMRHGGLSDPAARDYLAAMTREKRYLRDVY